MRGSTGLAVLGRGNSPATVGGVASPDIPVLTGIRAGVHPTFDRIMLDFSGPRPQVRRRFVDELIQDCSGEIEWLTGATFAEVLQNPCPAPGT